MPEIEVDPGEIAAEATTATPTTEVDKPKHIPSAGRADGMTADSTELVADAEVVAPMGLDDARRLDKRIRLMASTVRDNLTKIATLVEVAKAGDIHLALGFSSWTGYLADAVGGQLELTTDTRRAVVELLTGEGMSQRAIAQAVGVNQATISRDQQVMHDASPTAPRSDYFTDAAEEADCMAMADASDAEFEKVLAEGRAEGDLSRHNVVTKCSASQPVTGLDGKTYTRPKAEPAPLKCPPTATFSRLKRRLAKLTALAEECLDVAVELDARDGWHRATDDKIDELTELAFNLSGIADGIVAVVEGRMAE
jgi:hypothetical protein